MGIWLSDGSFEPMFGDEREAFRTLVRDHLGVEAERAFCELIPDAKDVYDAGYDDGYREGYNDGCEY